ncbi:hypothetical protein D3C73_909870 [compost metagenome]
MAERYSARSGNQPGLHRFGYRITSGVRIADCNIHRTVRIVPPVEVEGSDRIFACFQREQINQRAVFCI